LRCSRRSKTEDGSRSSPLPDGSIPSGSIAGFAKGPAEYLLFADSDIVFLRDGGLVEMVRRLESTSAAMVAGEFLPEVENFVEPVAGETIRLAARLSPWLLLVSPPKLRALDESFAFQKREQPDIPEGLVGFDVGPAVYAGAQSAGMPCLAMPPAFRMTYRHVSGASWRERRYGRDRVRYALLERWARFRVARLRRKQD
jgi:hypothetical protein